MAMKTMVNVTLEKIIQRKILYCQNDNNQELANMNAGYVRGFNQMLEDMNLTETEFITKYFIPIFSYSFVCFCNAFGISSVWFSVFLF